MLQNIRRMGRNSLLNIINLTVQKAKNFLLAWVFEFIWFNFLLINDEAKAQKSDLSNDNPVPGILN